MISRSILCTLAMTPVLAVAAQIRVGPNVHVSGTQATFAHNEVVLAIDALHPGRMLACSMFGAGEERSVKTAAYVSSDSGKTWALGVIANEHFADDPTCSFGPDGTAYMLTKTNLGPPKTPFASDDDFISIRRSRDGGATWDSAVRGPQANDRPFLAIDMTQGPYRGRLYVAYEGHVHGETNGHSNDEFKHAFKLVYSKDQGATFSSPVIRALMDQGGADGANLFSSPLTVLSDGTVVALFGHAVTAPAKVKSQVKRLWLGVYRSVDGGETLQPAIKVADVQTSYNAANTRTVVGDIASDGASAKFRDRVYIAWADMRSGRAEILSSYSGDKGKTWSPAKRVSDDGAFANGRGPDNFMPTLAVNRAGVVGLLWYDRRDNPDNLGYYARFSASLDGGESWLPSVRVSEAPNAVPAKGQAVAALGAGSFSLTGGHTAGLAADDAGQFHALWVDTRSGVQQVWTATIQVQ